MVAYHPTNPNAFGLPTIIGSIGLYDAQTGTLIGLCDGTLPTALRTAAASALATSILAPASCEVLGFVGTGAQAVAHLHALLKVTSPSRVLIHDTNPLNEATFAQRTRPWRPEGLSVERAPLADVVSRSDVLTTATSIAVGDGPLFGTPTDVRPGLHVNAVGSDLPGKTELPLELLRRALVIPDHLEQCLAEGECQQLETDEVGPSLADVVRRRAEFRDAGADRITVFDSTGWVVEDQVVMALLMKHASERDLGQLLDLHHLPEDPMNPLESLPARPVVDWEAQP
jgi:ornithine cyclodeaminase